MGKRFLSTFFVSFFLLFCSCFSYGQMAVFIFGDSQVDVGNNNYLPLSIAKADFPHNGIDFPTKKPTGRFSNGKNAADFISEKLGVPTSPCYLAMGANAPYEAGVSFASAGAGILDGTDEKFEQAIPLSLQVTQFTGVKEAITEKLGTTQGMELLSRSVFVIVAGSNDLFDYFGLNKFQRLYSPPPQKYLDNMITTLKQQVKRLHSIGARKFLFLGVTMIGCVPSKRAQFETEECDRNLNEWAAKFNDRLTSLLKELKSELPSMSYTFFDAYSFFNKVNQNPSSYGFVETKSACCGAGRLRAKIPCLPIAQYCDNRRDHLFWDLYHPSEAAAQIFVDAMYDDPSSEFTSPVSLSQLVAIT